VAGSSSPFLVRAVGTSAQISAAFETTLNNGLFPTTPGYDLATGIGTPIMAALITGSS
jgi:hypothetical protein